MSSLKRGDRVRVTLHSRVPGYQAGEKGTVFLGPNASVVGGLPYFVVTMDKDGPVCTSAVFTGDEIELDG
jgi:hypothetical protein